MSGIESRSKLGITAVALMLALAPQASSQECTLCGDLFENGTVTTADITNLVHHVGWTEYSGNPQCGDVDGFATVNVRDLSWLVDFVVADGPTLLCPADSAPYMPVPNGDVRLLFNQVFPAGDTLVRVQLHLVTERSFRDVSLLLRLQVDGSAAVIPPCSTTASNTFDDPAWSARTIVADNVHHEGTDAVSGVWSAFGGGAHPRPPGRYRLAWFDVVMPASPDYRTITIELFSLPGVVSDVPMMVDSNMVGWAINPVGRIVDPPGDVNLDRVVTSADVIHLVNYTFKSGEPPRPLPVAGDQNCSGSVNSADVISLVNYVFKSGVEPCDIHTACTVNWEEWTCP